MKAHPPLPPQKAQTMPVPVLLQRLLQPTLLLPGESTKGYEDLRALIIDEVEPQSSIEWLWVTDLVEVS